jgi:hypothetical protein
MWWLDTDPGRMVVDPHTQIVRSVRVSPTHIVEPVYGSNIFSPDADIMTVALTYLVRTVNDKLRRRVSPVLDVDESGKVRERLAPATLLSCMWSQVYTAVSERKEYKRCPACTRWFDVGGQDGATVRRVYCTDGCRVRACRDRRDRAVQLAGEGVKPAAIVGRMKEEGHETDLDTVKKWLKAGKRRG